jgi:hypothetical protein
MARGSSQSDFRLSSSFNQQVELPTQSGFAKLGIGRRTDLSGSDSLDHIMNEESLFKEWSEEKGANGKSNIDNVYGEIEQYIAAFAQQEASRMTAEGNKEFSNKGTKGMFSLVAKVDGQDMQFFVPDLTVRISRTPIEPREGMTVKLISAPNSLPGVTLNQANLKALGVDVNQKLWFAYPDVKKSGELRVKALN